MVIYKVRFLILYMILTILLIFTLGSLSTSKVNYITYLEAATVGLIISLLLVGLHPVEIPVDLSLFNGLFHQSSLIMSSSLVYLVVSIITLQLLINGNYEENFNRLQIRLFSLFGGLVLMGVYDLLTLVIMIETQSFALYILASIHRNHRSSTYAGLKYFFLGSLASVLIMTGSVLIYSATGDTSFDTIIASMSMDSYFLYLGMAFIGTGLFFKVGVAPLHAWSIDVYQGVPTVLTAWLSIVPKYALITLLYVLISPTHSIVFPFTLAAGLSLIIGGLGGLVQDNIKRLLAYSTVSHLGFMFLIMINDNAFFYLTGYSLMSLNAFCVLILLGSTIPGSSSYSPITRVSQLALLYHRYPWASLAMAASLLSLAGIPPFLGFFTKLSALSTALNSGLWILALLGVISSLLSITYYLRIIALMVFDLNRTYSYSSRSFTRLDINTSVITSFIVAFLTLGITLYPLAPSTYLSYASILVT